MDLHRVVFHGSVLSALYQSTAASKGGFDGILFGHTDSRITQTHQDHEEAISNEERIGVVTGFICSTCPCSFYNSAGEIDMNKLKKLVNHSSDPVLGWMSFRWGPSTQPSMRETCVSHSFPTVIKSIKGSSHTFPGLFCLVNLTKEHNNATYSFQYRTFQLKESNAVLYRLENVPVDVLNVGVSQGRERYGNFWLGASGYGVPREVEKRMHGLKTNALVKQIEQVEGVYLKMISDLETLVTNARKGGAQVNGLYADLEQLKMSVMQGR